MGKNLQDIKDKLVISFSNPLKEYYKRHVVFWNDPEKEFIDSIDEINIDGVTVFKLTDKNFFRAKKLLNDDSTGNILIYDTTNIDLHNDWLADARLIYKDEEVHFDYYSLLMDELCINQNSKALRDTVKQYDKFFKNEERKEKLHKISPSIQTTTELHLSILATLCNAKTIEIPEILFNVFTNNLNIEENKFYKNIEIFGSTEILWKIINKYCGDCHENLTNAFRTIVFNALYQTMGSSMPSKVKTIVFNNAVGDSQSLVSEWTHSSDYKDEILQMISDVDNKLELFDLFDALTLDDLVGSDLFPSINNAILRKLFTTASTKALSGSKMKSIVEERRKMLWYDKYSNYYECLYSIGELFDLYDKYANGFHYVKVADLWKDYQNELCLFDTYYRHIHNNFYKTSLDSIVSIQDKLTDAINYVENLYKNYYLTGLNDSWINLIKTDIDSTGRLFNIKTQNNFYRDYVEENSEERLTIVIISDGMRFEVAKELANDLKYKLKADVSLEAIQSVFPAITKYGMAALLPGKKTIDDSMNVLVDGSKTDNLVARKAVLQKHLAESDAINYTDLNQMNSTEKKEFLKGKKIIYVYHNDIDNSGHDSQGESKVFNSCEESISKIISLIKSLTNARGSIKVIVTSDHGFLYSYNKLDEVDKLSVKSDDIVDGLSEKRCLVCKNTIDTDFLIPVKMQINKEDNSLIGYAPLQAIRIKSQGGSTNYVHGGLSLQEMMVPVVIFDNVRTDSKHYDKNKKQYDHEPVKIDLVTEKRTIYGLIASIEFYQTKPIGVDAVETNYEILFEDVMGKAVSNSAIICANKTDGDAVNRRFNVILNINPGTKTGTYYLLVNNQDNNETLMKVKFKIENSFGGDFDF